MTDIQPEDPSPQREQQSSHPDISTAQMSPDTALDMDLHIQNLIFRK